MRASPFILAMALAGLVVLPSSPAGARKTPEKTAPAREGEESGRDKPGKATKAKTPKPSLRLSADAKAGFAPLTIHFTIRLDNVEPDAEAFCHAGTFLMLAGADGPRIIQGEDPACLHAPEEKDVSLSWSHTFVVTRAGFYEFLGMVRTKDNTQYVSNAIPVRVLSSPGGS